MRSTGGAVASGFFLGVRGERPGGDQQAFVSSAGWRRGSHGRQLTDAALVALALEEDGEADQAEPVDTQTVNAAVAALAGNGDAVEVGLAQQSLGKALKGVRFHLHEVIEQLFLPVRFFGPPALSGSLSCPAIRDLRALRNSTR